MKRIWVVEDTIPVHELYSGGGPLPARLDADLVRYLVEQLPPEAWVEVQVRDLCATLCGAEYESTFFLSPDAMLSFFRPGALPPHAVIFDWEYPGYTAEKNRNAIERLLRTSFAYVQVYTHLGPGGVEPQLSGLREEFGGRLLPVRAKADVTPPLLAAEILNAWTGTIAGALADRVREDVFSAVERSLIEMCGVPRGAIASMTQGMTENLVNVVLAKVRDEIVVGGLDVLEEILGTSPSGESSGGLRRLISVWYYFFPADSYVRRGDLIDIDGELGIVVTPACHLERFPKKTGRHLTWLRCVRLNDEGLARLGADGYKFNDVGRSIVASHGRAGDALIVLPNVPDSFGEREPMADYVVLCHAWASRPFPDAQDDLPLTYASLAGVRRRCTLVDSIASAVVSRVSSVMSSEGIPDLPAGEQGRLQHIAKGHPGAAPVAK